MPALERSGGDVVGVLPVAGPGNGELVLRAGDAREKLAGVIVFAEVGNAGGVVDGSEVCPIKGARVVLSNAPAKGRARVDRDVHQPEGCGGSEHGYLD